jgi:hypothetical protein
VLCGLPALGDEDDRVDRARQGDRIGDREDRRRIDQDDIERLLQLREQVRHDYRTEHVRRIMLLVAGRQNEEPRDLFVGLHEALPGGIRDRLVQPLMAFQ